MDLAARTLPIAHEARFAALYQEHRVALFLFCLARTHDPDIADDIVQDVFERALTLWSRYDESRPFWPWIASIAARECIDTHRRRSYAEARTADLAAALSHEPVDETSAAALGRMEHRGLQREIARLPVRQRAALTLYALEGWSYADIAGQMGASVEIVKALIVRARTKLRDCRVRGLAAAVGGMRALRARMQRLTVWGQATSACHDTLAAWSQALASSGAVVSLVITAGLLVGTTPPAQSNAATTERPGAALGRRAATPLAFGVHERDERVEKVEKKAPVTSTEPPTRPFTGHAEHTAHDALSSLVAPPPEVGPDNATPADIAVSPGYDEDRTVYAAGAHPTNSDGRSALFVTRDGGASWERPAGTGLGPVVRLLLPPAHPADHRLFAVTRFGLQVSRDGGGHFETLALLPHVTDGAMSPAFHAGDPSVLLVAGGRLFEYRDDTGLTRPVLLGDDAATLLVTSVTYVPNEASAPTIAVGLMQRPVYVGFSMGMEVRRCARKAVLPAVDVAPFDCNRSPIADPRSTHLAMAVPPGRPGALWLLNGPGLLVSDGEGSHFAHALPKGDATRHLGYSDTYFIWDVAFLPTARGDWAVVAQYSIRADYTASMWHPATRPNPPLLRTDDGGRTWAPMRVDVPGFFAARRVAATPTGRLIAGGEGRGGLVCSADDGRTWARTCPTADTA